MSLVEPMHSFFSSLLLLLATAAATAAVARRVAAPYSIGLALVYYSRCCIYTELARAM